MKYLLDTNTCIRYLNGRSVSIATRLHQLEEGEAVICSVVKAEMIFGALRSQRVERTLSEHQAFFHLFELLAFDDAAAGHYGRVRAKLSASGTPIGGNDLLIAAIALANGLTLVTHNTSEFQRVPNLQIEDWEWENE